jgi:enoyl-CoA hydratase/3-hydroxyacyl-CoA dehydrogenase
MKIGVIGSGSIGPDLAYGFLSAVARVPGARVTLVDIRKEALDAGVERIQGYMSKGLARGKLDPKAAEVMRDALVPTLELADLADCEYVLEAASEDLAVKRVILKDLEAVVRPDCLIGFATSGIPRAVIAAGARHPERCFVNHPFYPAWRSLPIEVVLSNDAALGERMVSTLRKLGKVPAVTKDVPCFAIDDIFCNYVAEAARIVEEGLATPAQVDAIVDAAIGGGGPFTVMDLTRGNMLVRHCQLLMKDGPTGSAWFTPPPILEKRGAQAWHDPKSPASGAVDDSLRRTVLDRILAVLLARTAFVVEEGICSAVETNWMTRLALGFRTGLLELTEELGAERVRELCTRYANDHLGFAVPRRIALAEDVPFHVNLRVERRQEIGIVSVFRPEVRNALSKRTVQEIGRAVDALLADPSVRGIVMTSWDGALAGADINELAALQTPEECRRTCLDAHPVLQGIERAGKPIVAALDGPVMGGGAELSMCCHARVVGKGLAMSQPEVNLGIIPGYGGTQRLPRLVGVVPAAELLRTGRAIGADEAVRLGWAIERADGDVVDAACTLLRRALRGEVKLAPVSPEPIAVPESLGKVDIGHRSRAIDAILVDVLRRGLARPLGEGLAIEADGFGRCKGTVDMDIGMRNFIQNGPRVPAAFLHE